VGSSGFALSKKEGNPVLGFGDFPLSSFPPPLGGYGGSADVFVPSRPPVADNSKAAGRQLNRRVEMLVSGDVIGNGRGGGGSGTRAAESAIVRQP